MKTLFVVRHAKSSWNISNLDDYERPLNDRGKRDCPRMGKRLVAKHIHPDLMVSSPAKRALSTAKRIARELHLDKKNIKTDRRLYHADEETFLATVQELGDRYDIVMIFGHNPGLTEFVNTLMREEIDIDNVPTCGVVAFRLDVDRWRDVTWGQGTMLFFDYPKSKED